jgi:hypothetical protein
MSRVVPGIGVTIARSLPTRRLRSVAVPRAGLHLSYGRNAMNGRYWLRLLLVYVLTLLFGLGCVALAHLRILHGGMLLAVVLLPCVVAVVLFAVTLANSPWLRGSHTVLRMVMIIGGTIVLSLTLNFTGPGPSASRQPSRLLAWAEGVRKRAHHILAEYPPKSLSQR